MVLAVDIGNTNIVLGCFEEERLHFQGRLATDRQATELEYMVRIRNLCKLSGLTLSDFDAAIICSVVPQVGGKIRSALEQLVGKNVMMIGPGLKTGLKINIDNPAQLGADRVADAVGALSAYPVPLITIDMGTATTIGVVDEHQTFIGGMIVPGVMVSLNSLSSGTSQLPQISLEPPKQPIGRNTVDCMRSGIIYHNAAGVDGMIDRIEEQLGQKCAVVVTGGLAGAVIPYCRHEMIYDENLLLKGMMVIYNKNKRKKKRT